MRVSFTAWLIVAAVLLPAVALAADVQRRLYAVNEAAADRGTVSVYDIDNDHRLIAKIATVPNIADARGAAASATTGRLYVAYRDRTGIGKIYCLDLSSGAVLWDRAISPSVDRLAIDPKGKVLHVPTGEDGTADLINFVDATKGDVVRNIHVSPRSHDAQYPLSGPLCQETKARDGSGAYLYRIDPESNAVARIGPYAGILGPYAVDGKSRFVVNDVTGLWGMQVADLKTGRIVTALLPQHPTGHAG
jgi:DNA-binding beta-propeller fold protein YncE